MAKIKISFEAAVEALESITRELEENDVTLEASLKKFEEGMQLVELCTKQIDDAQKRIDVLLKKNNGLKSIPFDAADKQL